MAREGSVIQRASWGIAGQVQAAMRAATAGVYEEVGVLVGSGLAFVVAARPAARWLVDDAGITFAYGMNAGLHGQLGIQPESWATEGFSNPLMVAVVALLSALRLFHPLTTPAGLAALTFALEGLVAFRLLRDAFGGPRWVPWLGVVLFAALEVCTPATMIWYGSGLENGQLSLAILALLRRLQVASAADFAPALDAAILALCALVRPEAPVFVVAWLALAASRVVARRAEAPGDGPTAKNLARTVAYLAGLAAVAVVARMALFASLLPNTFYAKIHQPDLGKNYDDYVRPLLSGYWCALGFPVTAVALVVTPRGRALALPLSVFCAAALALPLVAGADWMGQHRFATAFLMLGHLSFAAACAAVWTETAREAGWTGIRRTAAASAPAVVVVLLFGGGRDEYRAFLRERYVGFALVADQEGFVRVDVQRYLGLVDPVVALPDVGGSAVVGGMQLVDTAYLADYHMARLRLDPALVTQYEVDERRVDLAEYHAWAFDRGLVGTKYLPVAHLDAERDYWNFFPVWAVRRDRLEGAAPGPDAVPLGAHGGIHAYLSGRTVPLAAPGSVLRVEVLLAWEGGSAAPSCDVGVALDGAAEQRAAFAPTPYGKPELVPSPGGVYRQGFLLPVPGQPGDYPLHLVLCPADGGADVVSRRMVRVRRPESIAVADVRDAVGAPTDALERARRIAALREQLVPRLSPAERRRLEDRFRASYRDSNHADARAYDRLVADSRPAYLDRAPPAVATLEQEVVEAQAQSARGAWSDGGADLGARTLAVGRRVDRLRRLGFLGLASRSSWAGLVDQVVDAPAAGLAPAAAYERALGLALMLPARAVFQRRLAAARLAGVGVPDDAL